MKLTDLRKFAAIAKEIGIMIEVVEDGRTIRFHPNFQDSEPSEDELLDRELAEWSKKHSYS